MLNLLPHNALMTTNSGRFETKDKFMEGTSGSYLQ